MEKPYFVMIYTASKKVAWPMEDKWTDVAFFETEQKARKVANTDRTAVKWGFEVCKMGLMQE